MGIMYNDTSSYAIKFSEYTKIKNDFISSRNKEIENLIAETKKRMDEEARKKLINITRIGTIREDQFFYRIEETSPPSSSPYFYSTPTYKITHITKEELKSLYLFLLSLKGRSINQVKFFLKKRIYVSTIHTENSLVYLREENEIHQYMFPITGEFIESLNVFLSEKPHSENFINEVLHFRFVEK